MSPLRVDQATKIEALHKESQQLSSERRQLRAEFACMMTERRAVADDCANRPKRRESGEIYRLSTS